MHILEVTVIIAGFFVLINQILVAKLA